MTSEQELIAWMYRFVNGLRGSFDFEHLEREAENLCMEAKDLAENYGFSLEEQDDD